MLGFWRMRLRDTALPLYQGIMIQPFFPSARGWLRGTGLRAKWDYITPDNLVWNPQYLMALDDAQGGINRPAAKIGVLGIYPAIRTLARSWAHCSRCSHVATLRQ